MWVYCAHRNVKTTAGDFFRFYQKARGVSPRSLYPECRCRIGPISTAKMRGMTCLGEFASGRRNHSKAFAENISMAHVSTTIEYEKTALYPIAAYGDNWPDAKKWFELALEQDNEDSLVLANLARCYEKPGDIGSAREQYQKIIRLNNDPEGMNRAKAKLAALEKK
jgi:tetratricopeptide (TPR) repeat protein